jgi:argininosuccinate lyase
MRKLWGGAFASGQDELVERFGQSIESDLTFWKEDVLGSIAHAKMLGDARIITSEEASDLIHGLEQILQEGPGTLPRDVEDIHTAVEARLQDLVGDVAGKLHTARSRNDQVATDTRLYLRSQYEGLTRKIKDLQRVVLEQGERHQSDLMPGYTHMQRAQPITLGFHLLAYFWALQRHGYRIETLGRAMNYSPLGSAALAGTSFPVDREATSHALGFHGPLPNALDATSDRSFILDALHVCALIMIDLSRLSQELTLWSGYEYGFVRLGDGVTTGSSIMPQKRNPDMAELIRGRSGRAIGNWTSLAATMKGLVLGYNRDTQDDKPPLFESLSLALDSLDLARLMLESADWQLDRMRDSVSGDFSTATDLADFLAREGMPFRKAHEVVGQVVRGCIERGWALDGLDPDRLRDLAPEVDPAALEVLSPEASVRRREAQGGPGPSAMKAQIERARALCEARAFEEVA